MVLFLASLLTVNAPVVIAPGIVQLDFPVIRLLTVTACIMVVMGALMSDMAMHKVLRLEVVVVRPSIDLPFVLIANAELADNVKVFDPLDF